MRRIHTAFAAVCFATTALTGDANVYIEAHNAKRLMHCDTECASLGSQLAAEAQEYADTCPTAHAPALTDGENLYWAGFTGSAPTVDASYGTAIDSWYDEISSWDFQTSTSSNGGVTGHFTQIVWKSSTVVGCGVNLNCNNMFDGFKNSAVVCRYQGAGNYAGQYSQKVMSLVSSGCSGVGSCSSDDGVDTATVVVAKTFSPYFTYTGSLAVDGAVGPMTTSGTTQTFDFSLSGVDPDCASGAGSAGNSCGVHIHAGTTCTADALGHYFTGSVTSDPWTEVAYTSTASGTTSGTFSVDTGGGASDVLGRAFVVHDHTGARIACAILGTDGVDNGDVDDGASSVEGLGVLYTILLMSMSYLL